MSQQEGEGPIFLDEYNKLYERFKNLPLIIEGPEFDLDYSYYLVDQCEELKILERGIPIVSLEGSNLRFNEEVEARDVEMEYRILTRINCHKLHYTNLFKSQNIDFKRKNRYNDILPFMHSMVKLSDNLNSNNDRYWYYSNANFVNVS